MATAFIRERNTPRSRSAASHRNEGHMIHFHVWEVVLVHAQASEQRKRSKSTKLLLCYIGLLQVGYLHAHFWHRY